MRQHSSDEDEEKRWILGDTQIWVGPPNALLSQMRDASCGRLARCTQDDGNLAPAIEPTQPDLPADDETEEQHEGRVLSRQRPLGLHATAKLLVQSLDHVGRPERLPLPLGKLEEREEFLAALLETADNAGAARGPLPLERGVGGARRGRALSIDNPVEVGSDLRQGVLGGLALQVAQLVDAAPLDQRRRPDEPDGLPETEVPVDHAPHG